MFESHMFFESLEWGSSHDSESDPPLNLESAGPL